MDKATMKAVFRDAGIPVCRSIVVRPGYEQPGDILARVETELGFPCFVKPCNLGSSVGISKVKAARALEAALVEASAYDPKVIVEEAIDGRELECGVLGNERAEASVVGELMPAREFYDYVDKYVDEPRAYRHSRRAPARDVATPCAASPWTRSTPSIAPAWRASTSSSSTQPAGCS